MKASTFALVAGLTLTLGATPALRAAETTTNVPQAAAAAAGDFSKTAEKRAGEIMKLLALTNSTAAEKVKGIVVGHLIALHDWHDANDAKLKGASAEQQQTLKASLQALHEKFLTELKPALTAEQIDSIKDKMTYNKVKVTYGAYCQRLTQLTEAQKAQILDFLKQAREEAMDAGSSGEKDKVFRQYKGKINNYLNKQGIKSEDPEKPAAKKAKTQPAAPTADQAQ